ncbi:MAG: septum formation initiator family protein [Bacteroidales bacterium]|nr:septum formation initiator family protein [Bacteroidales bacterium]
MKDIWKRSTEKGDSEQNSFVKYAIISFSVVFIVMCFLTRDNMVRWARAGIEISRQNHRIESLMKEIEAMDKEIRSLKENPDSLELFAREKFQFAEPGDDVYLIDE